jgi:hypothetical protein
MQNKVAKFAHRRNDSNWETSAQHRKIAKIWALFKAYTGEWAWKAIGDTIQRKVNHGRKIRSRKQRTAIGKYSFINRTIQLWNQLPAEALGTLSCKPSNFRERVMKMIHDVK